MSMKEFTPWNWFERRDLASKKGDYSLLNNFDSNYLKYNFSKVREYIKVNNTLLSSHKKSEQGRGYSILYIKFLVVRFK